MKIKRKFCRNIECDNCGTLLTYFIGDINVGRDAVAANKFFYIKCIVCCHLIDIDAYNIPMTVYGKLTKLYMDELNSIKEVSVDEC